MISFIPLGVLPHLGNKLWALKDTSDQSRFLSFTMIFIVTLAMLTLGGLLARALMGNALFAEGATSNHALPMLFIELFPTWLAALVGVGVLAAIMSTADGLVVSSSQTIANDLYRRTIAPRLKHPPSEAQLDRQVLYISRVATVVVLVVCAAIAWAWVETNVMLIIWIGTGGIMSAFAGSLVFGALWRGVTRTWGVCRPDQRFCQLSGSARPVAQPGLVSGRCAARCGRLAVPGGRQPVLLFVHCRPDLGGVHHRRFQGNPTATRIPRPGAVRGRVKGMSAGQQAGLHT